MPGLHRKTMGALQKEVDSGLPKRTMERLDEAMTEDTGRLRCLAFPSISLGCHPLESTPSSTFMKPQSAVFWKKGVICVFAWHDQAAVSGCPLGVNTSCLTTLQHSTAQHDGSCMNSPACAIRGALGWWLLPFDANGNREGSINGCRSAAQVCCRLFPAVGRDWLLKSLMLTAGLGEAL